MIPALSLTLILGGAISTQTPWNLHLLHNQHDQRAATWTLAGTAPKAYFVTAEGDSGFRLESNDDASPNDVETAYRAVMADKFPGKRIRVSLEMHTEGVKGGAGLWIRIDDKTGKLYYRNPERVEIRDQADANKLIDLDRVQQGVAKRDLPRPA